MHIVNIRKYFLDELVELLGIKSGLDVPVTRAVSLLDSRHVGERCWWQGPQGEGLRLEASELEYAFISLLHSIGAIDAPLHPTQLLIRFCRSHEIEFTGRWLELLTDPEGDEGLLPEPFQTENHKTGYVRECISNHFERGEPIPYELSRLNGFQEFIDAYVIRAIFHSNVPVNLKWNGIVPLDQLFQSEIAPTNPESYFDQRFIDYLSVQNGDLTHIHWRQFEYLTAEYFHRNGYEVTVGTGRGDGGTDVTAIKKESPVGPELVLIQCKRYGENTPIQINDVKALWSDAGDQRATRALIATTSRYPSGVREYCEARKYRLNAVEGSNVVSWLQEMKTSAQVNGSPLLPNR